MTTVGRNEASRGKHHIPALELESDIAGRGLWTAAETARWLTVPERMVRRLVAERRMPYVKVTRSKRIFELSEYCVDGGGVGD